MVTEEEIATEDGDDELNRDSDEDGELNYNGDGDGIGDGKNRR